MYTYFTRNDNRKGNIDIYTQHKTQIAIDSFSHQCPNLLNAVSRSVTSLEYCRCRCYLIVLLMRAKSLLWDTVLSTVVYNRAAGAKPDPVSDCF